MAKAITLNGLAKFMLAPAAHQWQIVAEYKHPKAREPQAMKRYYYEAEQGIKALHRDKHGPGWLTAQAGVLRTTASGAVQQTRSRLEHNARVLEQYDVHFSGRPFDLLKREKWTLTYGDVTVKVRPHMVVDEGKRSKKEKAVLLWMPEKAPEPLRAKILTQGLFEASTAAGKGYTSSCALLLDVQHGQEERGARLGARLSRDMRAACQTISAIWDQIP